MSEPDPLDYYDNDEICPDCGGEGRLYDECTCMSVADTCCCLYPEPPICRECNGRGVLPRHTE